MTPNGSGGPARDDPGGPLAALRGDPRRGVVLPFAVADGDGHLDFGVSENQGCSSTESRARHPRPRPRAVRGDERLRQHDEMRRIPALSSVYTLRGALPGARAVDFLKVDTQGTALDILRSAGALFKVDAVMVDALVDGARPL